MDLYLAYPGSGPEVPRAETENIALHARFAPTHRQPSEARHSRVALIEMIEGEIIPRLFMAHRHHEPSVPFLESGAGELEDPEFLAALFLGGDSANIAMRLQSLVCAGASRERIYIDLLAPVPGTLSRLWADGACSFDEIAGGLRCVDEVIRTLREGETPGPQAR